MAYTVSTPLSMISEIDSNFRFQNRGIGVISGTTEIDGVASPCRVFLHTSDGTQIGYIRTGDSGTYSFTGLAPGHYRLVIEDDNALDKQGKIVRVMIAS